LFVALNLYIDKFLQGALKNYFDNFMQDGTHNIRIPATVIRNSYFLGNLTPNILKAITIERQKTLNRVTLKLLEDTGQVFTNWVDSLESKLI
jgi:hypothetical protein